MTMPAEKVNAEKAPEKMDKTSERVLEKRRALGRGLESLLPGPRVVPGTGVSRDVPPALSSDGRAGASVPTSSVPTSPGWGADAGEGNAPVGDPAVLSDGDVAEAGTAIEIQAMADRTAHRQPVLEIPLDQIDQNPHQTRIRFDADHLQELAASIAVQGVIEPIVVRPGEEGRYLLILGDRRVRASKLAGMATIPAIVKRVSEQQAAEMTIVENLQRQDLHCLEQAEAFSRMSKDFGLTQETIGKRVGLSREAVSNYMRLLGLPYQVQKYLVDGVLSYSHARELLRLLDKNQILAVAEKAVKENMSVLQLDDLVMDINQPTPGQEQPRPGGGARWVDPNVKAAQRQLETVLGMRVRIRDRKGKGKITIEYGSLEDFDRVVRMLRGK